MNYKVLTKHADCLYVIARVLFGLLFAQHGAMKLFGAFGGDASPLFSLIGLAGIIEFFGGIFIAVGLFTRTSALLSAVTMIVAYFMAHAGDGLIPVMNGGELALVYLAGFLIILAQGAKKASLEVAIFDKEKY